MKNKEDFYNIIAFPFIWGMLIPILILHIGTFLYQAVAFRAYGIKRIKFGNYVNFDRDKLSYLSFLEKIFCAYCSYANGVVAYTSEIGHRTEYYWCGIKHQNQPNNPAFFYQEKFADYGSKEDYERVLLKSGRKPQE